MAEVSPPYRRHTRGARLAQTILFRPFSWKPRHPERSEGL